MAALYPNTDSTYSTYPGFARINGTDVDTAGNDWRSTTINISYGTPEPADESPPEKRWPDDWPNPYGHAAGRKCKQRPPVSRRVEKRRRKTTLAKHHRKVMRLAALRANGSKVSYPKMP